MAHGEPPWLHSSLHDFITFALFTKGLDQSRGSFNEKKFGTGTYVPFREGQNVPEKKTFLFVPLKEK
jgi:hypothetical protein